MQSAVTTRRADLALPIAAAAREPAPARLAVPSHPPGANIPPGFFHRKEAPMKRSIVCCVVAGLLVSGVTGVGVANPEWVADAGLDFWNLPRMNSEMDRLQRDNAELDQQAQAALNRLAAKQDVGAEVSAGQF